MVGLSIYFLYNLIFASIQHNMINTKIIQWDPEESQMTYEICFQVCQIVQVQHVA